MEGFSYFLIYFPFSLRLPENHASSRRDDVTLFLAPVSTDTARSRPLPVVALIFRTSRFVSEKPVFPWHNLTKEVDSQL